MDVGEDEAQVVGEELRDGGRGPQTHDVDVARGDDLLDGLLEGIDVHLVQRRANVLDVRLEHLV